ncbi:uncharacterized protein ARMOST_02959 [Armillaria ostoyae]|uniref:Uncharacterized protein n=1 Tax=Armillaria ostoyae TaxID=47428 RepID=A0A284QTD2_ARMOS|nr:uncharacterized protein ARMOST_02959 [Armillaria ostoyae]
MFQELRYSSLPSRNRRGTFGLTTELPHHHHTPPTTLGPWYQASHVPGWTFPVPYNAQTPDVFPPIQRVATLTPQTLSPDQSSDDEGDRTPGRSTTPLTPMALTTSGQPLHPSTKRSSDLIEAKLGRSEDRTLKEETPSSPATTKS